MHATPNQSFPSSTGHWECDGKPEARWHDTGRNRVVEGRLDSTAVQSALHGRWLLILGDSSMRMLFHFLVGVLSLGWSRWPHELGHGHSPGWPGEASCLDAHNNSCLQDVFLRGVRLTCAWYDFNDDDRPPARLQSLADDSLSAPDVVVASIGAWHSVHRRNETAAYARAVDSLMRQVDEQLFPVRTGASFRGRLSARGVLHRIFAATTSCARAWPQPDGQTRTIAQLNRVARRAVAARRGWAWFDREAITGTVCMTPDGEFPDCAGGKRHVTSRYHPSGRALNVLVNLLAEVISQ